jgi:hypothetical protein
MAKFELAAYLWAADEVGSFVLYVSGHGLRGRLTARSLGSSTCVQTKLRQKYCFDE